MTVLFLSVMKKKLNINMTHLEVMVSKINLNIHIFNFY